MDSITIRRARPTDFDAVTQLWKEMITLHLSHDPRFKLAPGHVYAYKDYLHNIHENYDYAIFVAEIDGTVLGYTIGMILTNPPVFDLERYGFIAEMAVTEASQKQGIGQELWKHIRRWFYRRGIKVIQLNVSPYNERGYNFWKKVGCNEFLRIMWHDIPKNP